MNSKERIVLSHPASLKPSDYATFVEIDPFLRQWGKLGLADQDLLALQIAILVARDQTPVIPEGGGLRKIRFSKFGTGKGKRGSYRAFYAYFFDYDVVLSFSWPSWGRAIARISPGRNCMESLRTSAISKHH